MRRSPSSPTSLGLSSRKGTKEDLLTYEVQLTSVIPPVGGIWSLFSTRQHCILLLRTILILVSYKNMSRDTPVLIKMYYLIFLLWV